MDQIRETSRMTTVGVPQGAVLGKIAYVGNMLVKAAMALLNC